MYLFESILYIINYTWTFNLFLIITSWKFAPCRTVSAVDSFSDTTFMFSYFIQNKYPFHKLFFISVLFLVIIYYPNRHDNNGVC